nr:hypothetical protein [Salinibacter ruber]
MMTPLLGSSLRLFGPVNVGCRAPLCAEHVAMEKQKRIQGLVLRGGGDVSAYGEAGQVVPNFFLPKRTRMLSPVVLDVADDPATVRFFGLVRVARSATGCADAV